MNAKTFDNGARTDVHRPQVFEPTDYECRSPWDTEPPYPDVRSFRDAQSFARAMADRQAYIDSMRAEFGGRIPHSCDHCGAHFRYCWSVDYKPSGAVVAIGEICVSTRLDLPGHDAFALAFIQSAASRVAAENKRFATLDAWTAKNPGVAEWLAANAADKFDFIRKMAAIAANRPLTDGQTAAIVKMMARKAERDALRATEAAAYVAPVELAPVGAATVKGTVLSVKEHISDEWGVTLKMLVKLADGNKVYGSVPAALLNGLTATLNGKTVEFTATFTRKEDHFSFYARPRKVAIVDTVHV